MSARIISVANIKGGVSKTSTGVFLATALAKNKNKKVLYLDCDDQAGSAYQYRQFEKTRIYEGKPEPYKIRAIDPTYIFDTIDDARDSYDIIFIDMPRYTRKEADQRNLSMMLALCDSVLIPFTSGELDDMSTREFIEILQKIESNKKKNGRPYQYVGFGSMTGLVPTDDKVVRDDAPIAMLENGLSRLKRFSKSYTFESLLDIGKGERERFEPFFNEVTKFFNL